MGNNAEGTKVAFELTPALPRQNDVNALPLGAVLVDPPVFDHKTVQANSALLAWLAYPLWILQKKSSVEFLVHEHSGPVNRPLLMGGTGDRLLDWSIRKSILEHDHEILKNLLNELLVVMYMR